MEKQILIDPMIKPDSIVLESLLGKNYKRYLEFESELNKRNLIIEWRYYNDTKSWLGKILHKKKNLCWLSVWNTGFKLTFYFTEKIIDRIWELGIDDEIKNAAKSIKPVGKFIPVIVLVKNKKMINNALKILEYKMQLK